MKGKWSLRDYEDGDEEQINPLLNQVYKINRDLPYWKWEFKGNPRGFNMVLAVDGERIIGHLASLKRMIKMGDSEELASMEVEGVTHPEYQRQGIFVALGKRILSDLKKENVSMAYGFPNENALPGHRKLNCVELFKLHIMIRPVNFKRISNKIASNRILGGLYSIGGRLAFKLFYRPRISQIDKDIKIRIVNDFDRRFDEFWEKIKTQHDIILKRNSDYLHWRYKQCPTKQYKIFVAEKDGDIHAWAVVRTLEKFGLKNGAIVDILALPDCEDIVGNLLSNIEKHFVKERVDLMACSIPRSSIYYKILRKSGYMDCPRRLNPKEEPFIIYPLSNDVDVERLKKASNWFITWGDTDVV
jgi:hypothetical protein